MRNHLRNVVHPDDVMGRVAAHTTRLAVLYGARPSRALNWTENGVQYCNKFLRDLWAFAAEHLPGPATASDPTAADEREDAVQRRAKLENWCATAAERVTEDLDDVEMQRAVKNVMRLFDRIEEFTTKAQRANRGELSDADARATADALVLIAQLLTPFAPHVGEELWIASGREASDDIPWPASEPALA
jgi:leucyl-tRNA synthetase